ncbi:MAG: alpha/beta hydrolase family protein, partial [Planctomycetota bacterium]
DHTWSRLMACLSPRATSLSAVLITFTAFCTNAACQQAPLQIPPVGATFPAADTLNSTADPVPDAEDCLKGLRWKAGRFQVECEAPKESEGDLLIRFPSPINSGDAVNDRVSMEWYVARDAEKRPVPARSVIVVHESGRGMTVGRVFARGLNARGLHTFLIHLPGYGARYTAAANRPERILDSMKQAVADVRRARDAAIALPAIQSDVVGVQGTSLGGFVTSTAAGLDATFNRVFILLAGGNLHNVVLEGKRDAAKVRQRLESIGVTPEQIRSLARPVEPLRLAHRLQPASTWLYSGRYDDVVPPACSKALVDAAKLPPEHHIELAADHYSGVLYLPLVINRIAELMVNDQPVASDQDTQPNQD